jgi:sodium pump decarboxylase gamma subunit
VSEFIQRAIELPWGYIMGTLFIRFIGVFVVLAILMVAMQLLGRIVSRIVDKEKAGDAKEKHRKESVLDLAEHAEGDPDLEEAVAAIGAAIAAAMESETRAVTPPGQTGVAADSWAMAGRMALMNRRLPAGSQRRFWKQPDTGPA